MLSNEIKKGSYFSITSFSVPQEFVFSNQFIIDFKRLNTLVLKFKANKKLKILG